MAFDSPNSLLTTWLARTRSGRLREGRAPDLVIWNEASAYIRFVEVKCLGKDHLSPDQIRFHDAVLAPGSQYDIVGVDARVPDARRPIVRQ
jgi:hypothetical protein